MPRKVSKRPSPAAYPGPITDDVRKPVPTVPYDPNRALYEITPLGHVYRDDGRLLTPTHDLKVNFRGGHLTRSLPVLVFRAFGNESLVASWRDPESPWRRFDPWVEPLGPLDPAHGRPRCTVKDVVLVPHAELIRFGRYGRKPKTRYPIWTKP